MLRLAHLGDYVVEGEGAAGLGVRVRVVGDFEDLAYAYVVAG